MCVVLAGQSGQLLDFPAPHQRGGMDRTPILHDGSDHHRARRLGQKAELQKMLVDFGAIPPGTADPNEDGAFERAHHVILVPGRGIVNPTARHLLPLVLPSSSPARVPLNASQPPGPAYLRVWRFENHLGDDSEECRSPQ